MEILKVYEAICSSETDYCVVCFRTASERRLVNANPLNDVINRLQESDFKIVHKGQKLCFVCSRQVQSALRLLLATSNSQKLHKLFETLQRSKMLRRKFYHMVRCPGQTPLNAYLKDMIDLDGGLKEVRERSTNLKQTAVLLLNTGPEAERSITTPLQPISNRFPLNKTPSLIIPPQTRTGDQIVNLTTDDNVLAEPEIYLDSVVTLDEADPIEVLKQERPDSPLIIPDSPLIIPDSPPLAKVTPSTTTLKVKKISVNPFKLTVPTSTLNLHKLPGYLNVNSQQSSKSPVLLSQSPTLLNQNPTLSNQNPTLLNQSPTPLNSSPALLNNSQILFNNPTNKSVGNNSGFIMYPITNNGLTNLPCLSAQISDGKLYVLCDPDNQTIPIVGEMSGETTESCNPKRKCSEEEDYAKRKKDEEALKSGDTDWEAKIPMDVISFMDATDPNADEFLKTAGPVQPLTHTGVISNVWSVSDSQNRVQSGTTGRKVGNDRQMATTGVIRNISVNIGRGGPVTDIGQTGPNTYLAKNPIITLGNDDDEDLYILPNDVASIGRGRRVMPNIGRGRPKGGRV